MEAHHDEKREFLKEKRRLENALKDFKNEESDLQHEKEKYELKMRSVREQVS